MRSAARYDSVQLPKTDIAGQKDHFHHNLGFTAYDGDSLFDLSCLSRLKYTGNPLTRSHWV